MARPSSTRASCLQQGEQVVGVVERRARKRIVLEGSLPDLREVVAGAGEFARRVDTDPERTGQISEMLLDRADELQRSVSVSVMLGDTDAFGRQPRGGQLTAELLDDDRAHA